MNYLECTFLSKLENVSLTRSIAVSFVLGLNLELSILDEIKTIVSEAVTNAIVHGYQQDETKNVIMKLKLEENVLEIKIIDFGIGIPDINQARTPLYSTKQNEERAGLGFTIIDIFSDKLDIISVPNQGTTVICQKILK